MAPPPALLNNLLMTIPVLPGANVQLRRLTDSHHGATIAAVVLNSWSCTSRAATPSAGPGRCSWPPRWRLV